MTAMLVWILVFTPWAHRPAAQLGPFVDLASCERVAAVSKKAYPEYPHYWGTCVQVNMPRN